MRSVCLSKKGAFNGGRAVRKVLTRVQSFLGKHATFAATADRKNTGRFVNFLARLFLPKAKPDPPDLLLGRYTDAFKTEKQLANWERAQACYKKGQVVEAGEALLHYLRDDTRQNVQWEGSEEGIRFSLLQGSQRIVGQITPERVRAESTLAQAETLSVGFMRRLMEFNFQLNFCRFALSPNNALVLCFDTPAADASPIRLSRALRELAIWADKHDDLLVDEFCVLVRSNAESKPIPQAEKEAKYLFMCQQIRQAFEWMDKGDPDPGQHPVWYAYLLLALIYRIDYLVRPEGFVMDVLERASRAYFAQSQAERDVSARVQMLRRELQKILDRPREQVLAELYRTESTFGIALPTPFDRLVQVIDNELSAMNLPLEKGYNALAMAVPRYIVGRTLFQYVPPKPVYELLRLFMRATEPEFFRALGLPVWVKPNGQMDKGYLLQAVEEIVRRNRSEYPNFQPQVKRLDFSSLLRFSKTFLEMISRLNLAK